MKNKNVKYICIRVKTITFIFLLKQRQEQLKPDTRNRIVKYTHTQTASVDVP